MTWDALAAIGEIVGAIAVIVTLLYLAKQIRQNTRSVSVAALRDTTAQWNHWSEMLATSPDLAEVVAKGNRSIAALSESQSLRYGAYVQSFFDNAESYRALVIDHAIEKDIDVLESIVRRRLAIAGFSEWWLANTADYGADYVEWVEAIRTKIES
jgi:hypothetical protein